MREEVLIYGAYAVILLVPLSIYLFRQRRSRIEARDATEKSRLAPEGPRAQHPHIDVSYCIGCQSCTSVCPEGTVLAMVGGKAAVVNGFRCIGHSLCADACPVGAITMVMASPSVSANLPFLTPEYETTVPNLFIAGELGGLALIRNAVNQGRDCIDVVAQRLTDEGTTEKAEGVFDVLIVGAGPAGISAALRAIERKLNYVVIERDEIGGTVSKFPRQKLVLTAPVEFPLYGSLKKMEFSKEYLLSFWATVTSRPDFHVFVNERVEDIRREPDGAFSVTTNKVRYRARAVILAMGRAGTPRKLGVKGEDLPKVMYRLIEADHYINKNLLVVGGGDSAVEAALGLARQRGNTVTISYRRESFDRIKQRNAQRLEEAMQAGKIQVLFGSNPVEFTEKGAILSVGGVQREVLNDFVWIFAGGVAPNEFLKGIGVKFGPQDLTREVGNEARQASEQHTTSASPGDAAKDMLVT